MTGNESGQRVEREYVVFELADDSEEVHGGPYPPADAGEIADAMARHVRNGNYSLWSIPTSTERVKTVPESEWTIERRAAI